MIRYALKCEDSHRFESWFQSGAAFEALMARGLVTCPDCGSASVTKDLMAPKVAASRGEGLAPRAMTNAPDPDLVEAISKLRKHVEETSDYVGDRFAHEARAMHDGDQPHRPIYGDVKPEEARKLIEDGVPALPLPFIPKQKTN
jgi:hypothetical protein